MIEGKIERYMKCPCQRCYKIEVFVKPSVVVVQELHELSHVVDVRTYDELKRQCWPWEVLNDE